MSRTLFVFRQGELVEVDRTDDPRKRGVIGDHGLNRAERHLDQVISARRTYRPAKGEVFRNLKGNGVWID